jgi:diadenosine tetraphosphate (Ap4A) HIT family hydrolase
MFSNSCDFCNEFSDGNDNAFARIYAQQPKSRIVFRSENFAVVPSLGQIVEGHMLIVPVRHYTALADMPAQIVGEVSELCVRVRSALAQSYGPTVFFEHGVRGTQAGGCGVDHAHLHAVPFTCSTEPIDELMRSHCLNLVGGIAELQKEVVPNSSYLYYEQTNGRAWACEIDFVPSQYLRKMVAESLGIESWDWRVSGREQALLSSITRLSGLLGDSATAPPTFGDSGNQTALTATAAGV